MSTKFFVYHVTGTTYSRIIFRAMYMYTLKGIGKIDFTSELTI